MFKRIVGSMLPVIGLILVFASSAMVQAQQTTEFKVGDRVDVGTLNLKPGSLVEQKWAPGTITQIDRRPGYRPMYVVTADPLPGQLPDVYYIPITRDNTETVRLRPKGGAAPTFTTDKLHIDANGTVLADREVLDCTHFNQPTARNGSPLPAELAKKLIRCAMGENPSPPGGQGATKVDITQFAIGAPRRWELYHDTGFGGTADTIVYPVRAKFTTKSFHLEQNIVLADREQTFVCHVDVGKWICGPDQVIKDGQKSQIQVTK